MSLDVFDAILGITPVPGLSSAFTVFKFIVSAIRANQSSKKQLVVLANALGQLLATLHREFQSSRLITASCMQPLRDLMRSDQILSRSGLELTTLSAQLIGGYPQICAERTGSQLPEVVIPR